MTTSYSAISAISGLVADFDPAANSPIDGQSADILVNRVDSTFNALKSGAPKFKTNILNGKTVVRLIPGAGDYFSIQGGGIPYVDQFDIFIVHKTTGDTALMQNSATNSIIRMGDGGNNRAQTQSDTASEFATSGTFSSARTNWNILEVSRTQKGLLQFWEAGTIRDYGYWTSNNHVFTHIGLGFIGTADGDFARVLIFNRKLTVAERATVYDYLKTEFAINPAFAPTSLTFSPPHPPKLYSNLFQQANGAGVDLTRLGIGNVHALINSEVDTMPHFIAALTSRFGAPGNVVGRCSLELEVASPALLPPTAAGYSGLQYLATDKPYIISLLDYGTTSYPNVVFGMYQPMTLSSQDLLDTSPFGDAHNADWFKAYTGTNGFQALAQHAAVLEPSIYPLDQTETQDEHELIASTVIQLNRDVNAYYMPQVVKPVCVWMWMQSIGGVGGPADGTLLGLEELTGRFKAVRKANPDAIYLGMAGQVYTTAQWQAWADGTLRQALIDSGLLTVVSPKPRYGINDLALPTMNL